MKLYRLNVFDAHEGTIVIWAGNQRDVRHALEGYAHSHGTTLNNLTYDLKVVAVPTGKYSLIRWLNENFNRDNG